MKSGRDAAGPSPDDPRLAPLAAEEVSGRELGSVPRFLAAGLFNTGLTYLVYLLLLQVTPYRVAFTLAYAAGILVSYALSSRFVFRRQASWRSFLRFPLVYLAQYLAGLALVSMLVEWLAVATWLAPIAALVVTIPLTYILSRAVFSGARPI